MYCNCGKGEKWFKVKTNSEGQCVHCSHYATSEPVYSVTISSLNNRCRKLKQDRLVDNIYFPRNGCVLDEFNDIREKEFTL
jgi:hypothetical protein